MSKSAPCCPVRAKKAAEKYYLPGNHRAHGALPRRHLAFHADRRGISYVQARERALDQPGQRFSCAWSITAAGRKGGVAKAAVLKSK